MYVFEHYHRVREKWKQDCAYWLLWRLSLTADLLLVTSIPKTRETCLEERSYNHLNLRHKGKNKLFIVHILAESFSESVSFFPCGVYLMDLY